MNTVLLMMGGSGVRFGSSTPKQYTLVNGIPIFGYILKKYDDLSCVDKIIIVTNKEWYDYTIEWCDKLKINKIADFAFGGANRSESILNGLKKMNKYAKNDDVVLIHDTTHPYVDEDGCEKIIEAMNEYDAATLVSKNYDTVYQTEDDRLVKVLPRNDVVAGASPEAFKFGLIFDIYSNASEEELEKMTSAGAIALSNNIKMKAIPTDVLNLKITFKNDLELFESLVDNYFFKEDIK